MKKNLKKKEKKIKKKRKKRTKQNQNSKMSLCETDPSALCLEPLRRQMNYQMLKPQCSGGSSTISEPEPSW